MSEGPLQCKFFHYLLDSPGDSIEDKRPLFKKLKADIVEGTPPVLIGGIEGIYGSISSQIAVELAVQAVEEQSKRFFSAESDESDDNDLPLASTVIRESFKVANQQVYDYAHRMGAGGKVSASGFISCFDGRVFSAARVGKSECFIVRDAEVVALHKKSFESFEGVVDRFIGANSQILVDVASIQAEVGDIFILLNFEACVDDFKGIEFGQVSEVTAERIVVEALSSVKGSLEHNIYAGLLQITPELITLTDVIETED